MNIVITGSSRGIGLKLAKALIRRGHSILIHGRDREHLALTFAKLKAESPEALLHLYACDITNYNSVERMLWESNRFFGSIDIWINNAGSSSKVKIIGIENVIKAVGQDDKYKMINIYNVYSLKFLQVKKHTLKKIKEKTLSLLKIRNSKDNLDKISEQIEKNRKGSTIIKNRSWLRLWKKK